MTKFFDCHEKYDAVHARHMILNAPCILAAKKAGIPVRVAHCAVNRPKGKFKDRGYVTLYLAVCAKILNKYAIQYVYDINVYLQTLEMLKTTDYKYYVPSHGEIEKS